MAWIIVYTGRPDAPSRTRLPVAGMAWEAREPMPFERSARAVRLAATARAEDYEEARLLHQLDPASVALSQIWYHTSPAHVSPTFCFNTVEEIDSAVRRAVELGSIVWTPVPRHLRSTDPEAEAG